MLAFEGDERLQIPAGTEDERVQVIRRYWSAWPEHRDAVLERYAEALKSAGDFRERYPGKPPVTALKKFQKDEPSAWAVFASRAYYDIGGGPLGVELFDFEGNLGPVDFSELGQVASASDDDLRRMPPVRVGFHADVEGAKPDPFVIIAGQSEMTPLASLRDKFEAARAFGDLLDSVASGDPLVALRSAYRSFAASFWEWRNTAGIAEVKLVSTPGILLQLRPKQTFHPIARVEQAYAANTWVPTADGRGLVHRTVNGQRKKDLIEVLLAPLENPEWFVPATVDDLRRKLDRIGANGTFIFAVVMSVAIGNEAIDLEMNDFIKMLGLDPRSEAQRAEYQAVIWECLQLFSQTQVVGEIQGNYRDRSGSKIRIEKSPMIAMTGRQYPREMRLDKSETPIAVSFVAGSFFRRHRENRKLMADFGDLRALAAIPRGQAAGAWACNVGLALYQIWRERAHDAKFAYVGEDQHKTIRFGLMTRRQLFERVAPEPNPFTVLDSTNPKRAQQYWDDAVGMLVAQKILSPGSSTKARVYPRKGWAPLWLDEELDLRPHRENFLATQQVQAIADGAQAFKRKRGRPRKNAS